MMENTLQPQTMDVCRAEIAGFLAAGDPAAALGNYANVYARLAARLLLEGDIGSAVGWAELHTEALHALDELFARKGVA